MALIGELSDGRLRMGREAVANCSCDPDSPAWRNYYLDGSGPFRDLCRLRWLDVAGLHGPVIEPESCADGITAGLLILGQAEYGAPGAEQVVQQCRCLQDLRLSAAMDMAQGCPRHPESNVSAALPRAPAWRFLLQVFVPCVQKHGRRPDQLFADFAKRGDATVLQQLMTFNSMVRAD